MAAAAAAKVASDLQEVKGIVDGKIGEMDNKLNAAMGEIRKLPTMEAKVGEVEQRLTAYTEALATQQNRTTELMMAEIMKMAHMFK